MGGELTRDYSLKMSKFCDFLVVHCPLTGNAALFFLKELMDRDNVRINLMTSVLFIALFSQVSDVSFHYNRNE